MAEPLSAHLAPIADRVRLAPRFFVFLDFDGTLVPIVNDPMKCRLTPELRATIAALARSENTLVGIVSGRDLADLQPRVGIEGIAYAGNHGFEIAGPGFTFREPLGERLRPELDRLVEGLREAVKGVDGAWVQHKGYTASVHYRQADPAFVPAMLAEVRRIVQPEVEAGQFLLRPAKAVLEVRPAVDWHKGRAVHWLMENCGSSGNSPLVMYIGDDETDEDAFRSLPGEVTICVNRTSDTAAAYSVSGPDEVGAFLQWLVQLRSPD